MLDFLDIHKCDVDHADGVFQAVCNAQRLDMDTMYDRVRNAFVERYDQEFGNTIIRMMFDELAWALEHERGIDGDLIDYTVNGICSDFYIDGEQAY